MNIWHNFDTQTTLIYVFTVVMVGFGLFGRQILVRQKATNRKLDSLAEVQGKIHILTNSGMRASLVATVMASKDAAVSKHRLADLTGAEADKVAARYADSAVQEAETLVDLHDAQIK